MSGPCSIAPPKAARVGALVTPGLPSLRDAADATPLRSVQTRPGPDCGGVRPRRAAAHAESTQHERPAAVRQACTRRTAAGGSAYSTLSEVTTAANSCTFDA